MAQEYHADRARDIIEFSRSPLLAFQ